MAMTFDLLSAAGVDLACGRGSVAVCVACVVLIGLAKGAAKGKMKQGQAVRTRKTCGQQRVKIGLGVTMREL